MKTTGHTLRELIGVGILLFLAGLSTPVVAEPSKPWPFHPPETIPPPVVESTNEVRNAIDQFVLEKLELRDLGYSPEAPKRILLRRLYYDLIGLPPTVEEVAGFLKDDSLDAYEKVVDRLLADPRHGERWAKFWLDLARYADTAGYEGDPDLPHAWRYRDYVIDSFNQDKPYDLFIKEQIAGDEFNEIMGAGELPMATAEQTVATTFLRLAPFTEPRGDQTRHEMLSEMTSTVSSVFLGLTVGCAQCHDHKYDGIPTRDFYRMKAFFNTVQLMPPERGDAFQIGGSLPADFYREGEAEVVTRKRDYYQGIKNEFDTLRDTLIERAKASRQSDDEKINLDEWLKSGSDGGVSPGERLRYEELREQVKFVPHFLKRLQPRAMSLRHSFGPPYEPGVPVSRVMIRGEHDNPGEIVEAGFLSCITGDQGPADIRLDPFKRWPTRSRRMTLANWIASPENPLTARVMMNRLWYHHFGRGIVETPSDFGQLSGGPSHPELLDWLALRFVEEKWSLKAMHKLMVMSGAYRQDSQTENGIAEAVDADNRLFWKFNRRRLGAEAIRDSVLYVSGRLNPEVFGLPIFPRLPDDIADRVKYDNSKWATDSSPESRKRSIYIYQQRTLSMPFMQTFDGLVCEDTTPRRRVSVTPFQALSMYNGRFVNEESGQFASRVVTEAESDHDARLRFIFEIAYGRLPTETETSELRSFTNDRESLVALSRIIYNSSEFVYVD